MVVDTHDMTGTEKASVLLMSLDPETSTEVLKHLSAEQQEVLGAQIVRMRHVGTITRQRVLDEVRTLVRKGLADEPPVESKPLEWLEAVTPEMIAKLLESERPQSSAMVIAHLRPRTAALVLSSMGDDRRNHAAHRLAGIRGASDEAVRAVDDVLRRRYSQLREASSSQPVRRIVSEVQSPEELVFLPDSELRAALGSVSVDDLVLILQVASEDLRSAILANVSQEVATEIQDGRAQPSRPKVIDIELAQQRLMQAARRAA